MKNSKTPFSRRDFLTLLGQTTMLPLMQSPAQILIESIMLGAVRTAKAEGLNPRKYIQISHEGAPPRWMYDLFLTPYQTDIVPNGSVGTKFTDDGKGVMYSTVKKRGINVPHLWQFDVPKFGGGTRPMDELLANMLCIRGINIANPAHGGAQAAQSVPLGASQSMSALSGDPSPVPIPAVAAGLNQFRYLSKAAKTAVSISSAGNMLNTLLTPFIRKDLGGFTIKRQELDAALDSSVDALNYSAEALHPNADVISNSIVAAKDLMSKGFGDLNQIWSDLQNKYLSLIQRAVSPTQNLVGINNLPIISDGSKAYLSDLTLITKGQDIRTMITTATTCDRLASHFAMAEYVLINNLSSSISIGTPPLAGLTVNGDKDVSQPFDEHHTGKMPSLMVNAFWNLAFSACMLELIDRLKANNMFDETVIVSGAEFGRSPHADGSGSDHGYSGGSSIIISGALPADPMVLGNIYLDKKQDADDSGTWGYGAPVAELGKELSLGNWASTIATLLRVPTAVSSASSLLVDQAGTLKPTIELAKQVAGS